MIDSFKGRYRFLSNFFIEPDGSCVEVEFQAAKTDDPLAKVAILSARTPRLAKRLGREAPLIDGWDERRVHVMQDLVLRKFMDHKKLREALLDTGDEKLVEGNDWGDTFWGAVRLREGVRPEGDRPLFESEPGGRIWSGENHLGKILMEVREALR